MKLVKGDIVYKEGSLPFAVYTIVSGEFVVTQINTLIFEFLHPHTQ